MGSDDAKHEMQFISIIVVIKDQKWVSGMKGETWRKRARNLRQSTAAIECCNCWWWSIRSIRKQLLSPPFSKGHHQRPLPLFLRMPTYIRTAFPIFTTRKSHTRESLSSHILFHFLNFSKFFFFSPVTLSLRCMRKSKSGTTHYFYEELPRGSIKFHDIPTIRKQHRG